MCPSNHRQRALYELLPPETPLFSRWINASVLLADLYQKLEVTVYTESRSIRLLFPEYAYEFEDVVMPRQFRTITYGSGGRYRECITGDTIDLELYDSLFRVAKLEEDPETVALLALFRLMTPEGLRPERQTQYLSYLHEHLAPLGQCSSPGAWSQNWNFC